MTTSDTATSKLKARGRFRLPDPPEREPDEVTQCDQLFHRGLSAALALHLGNPETTLVAADRWVVPDAVFDKSRGRYPDLLVAFGVDPALYRENNGYIVSEQGKAPDWVLEVASESTGEADVRVKREYYRSLGIGEYWRFDHTPDGRWHGARLAGDRLVDGEYVAIEIGTLADGSLQGYSPALNLHLRWVQGELAFHDPATGQPIATLESERLRADLELSARLAAEAQVIAETSRADSAETECAAERVRADNAEARVRELEERLRNQER